MKKFFFSCLTLMPFKNNSFLPVKRRKIVFFLFFVLFVKKSEKGENIFYYIKIEEKIKLLPFVQGLYISLFIQ